MAECTSPLYRVSIGSSNFARLHWYDQRRLKNHGVFLKYDQLQSYDGLPGWDPDQVQILRCGQCQACRLAYSRDWAVRCALEASMHEHNYFVTLTYDDNFCPVDLDGFIDYDGQIYDYSLNRRDIQLFVKSLREWERIENGNNVRVFYVGEYGDLNGRPHFHLIVFGATEIPDLQPSFKRGSYQYFKSLTYERFWQGRLNGVKALRGFVDISEASFDTMAYTARYCMKKIKGKLKSDFYEFYEELDPELRPKIRVQPFLGMSLKPGIAAEYFEQNHDQILLEDAVKYQKAYELFRSKPPRYFDRLFERDYPEEFAPVRARRKLAGIEAAKLLPKLTDEDYLGRKDRIARIVERKVNKLVRPL